jgi:hypothetical protein
MLGAPRGLNKLALSQLDSGSANNQPLDQEGVAEPEDGPDVVILPDAVQHHRYRLAGQCRELRSAKFCLTQLSAR